MSNGPLPSQLCSLSTLPLKAVGDKVRFLGCVISYHSTTAILRLQQGSKPVKNVIALVDAELVLERLGEEQTRVGEWLNVIGYVKHIAISPTYGAMDQNPTTVDIQGLLIWSAGPLDIQQYHTSVEARERDAVGLSTASKPISDK